MYKLKQVNCMILPKENEEPKKKFDVRKNFKIN